MVAVVQTAARRAFLRSIKQNVDVSPISPEDFDLALRATTPSVSPAELERYRRLSQQARRKGYS